MQERTKNVFSATTTQWQTSAEVQKIVLERGGKPYLRSNALIELWNLAEAGLVEMKKAVVEGRNGGELVFLFRRKAFGGCAL